MRKAVEVEAFGSVSGHPWWVPPLWSRTRTALTVVIQLPLASVWQLFYELVEPCPPCRLTDSKPPQRADKFFSHRAWQRSSCFHRGLQRHSPPQSPSSAFKASQLHRVNHEMTATLRAARFALSRAADEIIPVVPGRCAQTPPLNHGTTMALISIGYRSEYMQWSAN